MLVSKAAGRQAPPREYLIKLPVPITSRQILLPVVPRYI